MLHLPFSKVRAYLLGLPLYGHTCWGCFHEEWGEGVVQIMDGRLTSSCCY